MKKGEIWLVELPSNNGHEQAGTRPVIILAETKINIAIILPLTSNLQALRFPDTIEVKPTHENGLKAISVALVFQIRAIDRKRIRNKIGYIESPILNEIDEILKVLLNIK